MRFVVGCITRRLLRLLVFVVLGALPFEALAIEQTSNNGSIILMDASQALQPILSPSCEGRLKIPNLIGRDIAVGREVMFENGYRPIINEDFYDSWESKYYPGISELVGCSNGIPWCIFNYENDDNVVILRTLGQQEIVEQEVICDAQKTE